MNRAITRFILCGIVLFSYSAASLEWENRCTYNVLHDGYQSQKFIIWDVGEFPLHLCVEWEGFTQKQAYLIKQAIDIWNTEYKKYVDRRWSSRGRQSVGGIPNWLFEINCNKYAGKKVIPIVKRWLDDSMLGLTARRRSFWTGSSIKMTMNSTKYWNVSDQRPGNNFFIDVLLHELGHVLGIPHIKNDDLMFPTTRHCNQKDSICRPNYLTFNYFLEFYDPYLYTPQEVVYHSPCENIARLSGRSRSRLDCMQP